jgi:hypothetical protein
MTFIRACLFSSIFVMVQNKLQKNGTQIFADERRWNDSNPENQRLSAFYSFYVTATHLGPLHFSSILPYFCITLESEKVNQIWNFCVFTRQHYQISALKALSPLPNTSELGGDFQFQLYARPLPPLSPGAMECAGLLPVWEETSRWQRVTVLPGSMALAFTGTLVSFVIRHAGGQRMNSQADKKNTLKTCSMGCL